MGGSDTDESLPELVASSSDEADSDEEASSTRAPRAASRGDAPAAQPAPAAPKPAAAPAPVAAPPAAQPVPAAPVVKKGFFSSAPAAARERAATAPTGAAAAAGGPVTLQDARKRRQEIAMQRPIQGKLDAELDQLIRRITQDAPASDCRSSAWPCRRDDLRKIAVYLHKGRSWGVPGERGDMAADEERIMVHLCNDIGKQASQGRDSHIRTVAIRTIKEILFMHGRVSKDPILSDPPQDLAWDHNTLPSLALSRSQFIKEVEKKFKLSELLVEDAMVLEEQAVRSGSVLMQSEEFKAQRWMRLDFLRFWFVESWAPATAEAAASASVAAGTQEQGMQISFKILADFRSKLQHDQEVWYRWVRLLLDCGKVLSRETARHTLQRLWVNGSGGVDPRLQSHGYECFRALFCEINQGMPNQPFLFEDLQGTHLGIMLSGVGMHQRRISWFDDAKNQRYTGTVTGCREPADGPSQLMVQDDETNEKLPINAPTLQHDMHLVEDWKSSPNCVHAPIKMSVTEAMRNRMAAAAASAQDDVWPNISALDGLGELSRMAVEVYDVNVSNNVRDLLLELVDIWEEVPGALYRAMHENGGVAVGRLRDEVARQRLASLEEDIISRAVMAVIKRGAPSACSKCKQPLLSAGDRAPRCWKDCPRKDMHTMCKGCTFGWRNAAQCPECNAAPRQATCGAYEPFGHVRKLLRDEEQDRRQKEELVQQLIQEEEAAKKAAEKKKKKKKKKGQGGDDAEKDTEAGTPGSGGAPGGALDGDADVEDWDNEDADHFCCAISMDIMVDPVFFGDGFSYERSFIEDYVRSQVGSDEITMKTKVASPRTQEMVHPIMLPNVNLKQAIRSWKAHQEKLRKATPA